MAVAAADRSRPRGGERAVPATDLRRCRLRGDVRRPDDSPFLRRRCTRPCGGRPGVGNPQREMRARGRRSRSEEHTSELQSLMRISYAVFCLKKKNIKHKNHNKIENITNTH